MAGDRNEGNELRELFYDGYDWMTERGYLIRS